MYVCMREINGQTSRLNIHVWTKCWILIMVQIVRKTQAIRQFKSLNLRGKLGGDGFIIINNNFLFFLRNILRIFYS